MTRRETQRLHSIQTEIVTLLALPEARIWQVWQSNTLNRAQHKDQKVKNILPKFTRAHKNKSHHNWHKNLAPQI